MATRTGAVIAVGEPLQRAFRKGCGKTPDRWGLGRRIDCAKAPPVISDHPMARCGAIDIHTIGLLDQIQIPFRADRWRQTSPMATRHEFKTVRRLTDFVQKC
jgi:hypothetical protein